MDRSISIPMGRRKYNTRINIKNKYHENNVQSSNDGRVWS